MSYVILDAGDGPIGAGRRYCVVTEGRKWMHIYYPPTCTGFKVSKAQYRAFRPQELVPGVDYSPKRTAKVLRAKRKQFEALGLFDGGAAAERALEALKAA